MEWQTFNGKKVTYDTIDHQHLSNCYWFIKIFSTTIIRRSISDIELYTIENKLSERFNGQLLPYRPHVDFTQEICELNNKGMLRYDEINSNRIIINDGIKDIGEILTTDNKRIKLDV